jgi:hypothetical protein
MMCLLQFDAHRLREDFPDPEGPTSATADPASIDKLKLVKMISLGREG